METREWVTGKEYTLDCVRVFLQKKKVSKYMRFHFVSKIGDKKITDTE